jgi:hypothetical protein
MTNEATVPAYHLGVLRGFLNAHGATSEILASVEALYAGAVRGLIHGTASADQGTRTEQTPQKPALASSTGIVRQSVRSTNANGYYLGKIADMLMAGKTIEKITEEIRSPRSEGAPARKTGRGNMVGEQCTDTVRQFIRAGKTDAEIAAAFQVSVITIVRFRKANGIKQQWGGHRRKKVVPLSRPLGEITTYIDKNGQTVTKLPAAFAEGA